MTMRIPHRLDIIEYVQSLYKDVVDDPNAAAPHRHHGIKFSTVGLGPLGDTDYRKRFVVGIVPGRETKSDLFPLKSCMFDLTLEFRATNNKGDKFPLIQAEQLMGVVQQVMYDDPCFDKDPSGSGEPLIIKHDEIANEIDMFTHNDRYTQGMVQFRIHYRHSADSVYSTIPKHR